MLLSELIGTHFIQTQISNFLYSLCKRFEISLSTSLSLDYYNEGINICYSRKFYSGQTNEKERKKKTRKKRNAEENSVKKQTEIFSKIC